MSIWSEETEEQMILLIQERPPLYDITEKGFSSRIARTKLWREIEKALTISEIELKKRWESLRGQYSRYKRLAASGGLGAKQTTRQQWILTRLQFLDPYAISQESIADHIVEPGVSDVDVDSDDSDTGTSTSQEAPVSPLEEPSFCEATDPLAKSTVFGEDSQTEPRSKRSRKTLDVFANEDSTVLMRTVKKTLETIASKRTDDEIASFCKNLESRMRKLSAHRLPYIMNDMENCLFKHLLEDQNQAQSGVELGTTINRENSDHTGPPPAQHRPNGRLQPLRIIFGPASQATGKSPDRPDCHSAPGHSTYNWESYLA